MSLITPCLLKQHFFKKIILLSAWVSSGIGWGIEYINQDSNMLCFLSQEGFFLDCNAVEMLYDGISLKSSAFLGISLLLVISFLERKKTNLN
jgi:hypothetical protein